MSKWYALAGVSTLKRMVCPWSTLISVAKPWIDALPEPLTSHWLAGLPVFVFSHAIGLAIGASQGAAEAGEATPSSSTAARATTASLAAKETKGTSRRYGFSRARRPGRYGRLRREGDKGHKPTIRFSRSRSLVDRWVLRGELSRFSRRSSSFASLGQKPIVGRRALPAALGGHGP